MAMMTYNRRSAQFCLLLVITSATYSVVNAKVPGDACLNADSGGDETCLPSKDKAVDAAATKKIGKKPDADPLSDVPAFEKDRQAIEGMTEEEILADAARGIVYVMKDGGEGGSEECRDDDDTMCDEYQDDGECMRNPRVMHQKCPLSCGICFESGVTPVRFGEEQMIDYYGNEEINSRIKDVIKKTRSYMLDKVYVEKEFERVRNDCWNHDRKCSYYAATGWCERTDGEDIRWVQENCSPACGSCLSVEYWDRCGAGPEDDDALQPGGLNAMFERIVRDFPEYSPRVLSRPEKETKDDSLGNGKSSETYYGDDDVVEGDDDPKPWVVALDDFLTADQCDFLIAEGHRIGYERSSKYADEVNEEGTVEDGVEDSGRTSHNAWCGGSCNRHPVTRTIMERMVNLTGIPEENSELPQLLRYEEGQLYEKHHDAVPYWSSLKCGQRVLTIFLYLNDVEEGGETRFNELDDLDVAPKRGMALVWPSIVDEDLRRTDEWTWHEARPVLKGVKYGANVWFHLRNFRQADTDGCT